MAPVHFNKSATPKHQKGSTLETKETLRHGKRRRALNSQDECSNDEEADEDITLDDAPPVEAVPNTSMDSHQLDQASATFYASPTPQPNPTLVEPPPDHRNPAGNETLPTNGAEPQVSLDTWNSRAKTPTQGAEDTP